MSAPQITVAVTARNEESAIGDCLRSLINSIEFAENLLEIKIVLVVVLNDSTDSTENVVSEFDEIELVRTTGGIVEAQRAVAGRLPFVVFSDADLVYEEDAIVHLIKTMLERPELKVAYPAKQPLRPNNQNLFASMLFSYNDNNGFQVPRPYFNGKCFAIRDWDMPSKAEVLERAQKLKSNPFLDFEAGMRVDDIYLSRSVLSKFGAESICEVKEATIWYRPPETLSGMYQTWKRMSVEFARMDQLFPEHRQQHVVRGMDEGAWQAASSRDRWLYRLFQICLRGCKFRLAFEKWYCRWRNVKPSHWPEIPETKRELS